jgi:threonyl-tRNA synthetase
VLVLPVADRHNDRAGEVAAELRSRGFRVRIDERTESVGRKIRDAELSKSPYMLVVGDKEIEGGTVSVRHHDEGDLGPVEVGDLATRLEAEVAAQ